jgi:hypothetical protein
MRCPEFYENWKLHPNFCEKDPQTAERIDAYLREIQKLDEISANCLNDKDYFSPFGDYQVSEGALRFLICQKDQKIHDETAKRLVKLAREKYNKCGKSVITGPEIQTIIARVKDETEAAKRVQLFVETTKRGEIFVHAKDPHGLKKIAEDPMIPVRYRTDIEAAIQYRRSPEFIALMDKRKLDSQINPEMKMACAILLKSWAEDGLPWYSKN